LANRSLRAGEAAPARDYAEQALPLLERGGERRLAAVCRAIRRLLAEVGEDALPHLLSRNVSCDVIEQSADTLRFGRHSDFRGGTVLPPALAVLRSRTLFAHLAPSGRLLDPAVPAGSSWSGPSWSYSAQPLRTVVTVRSASERIAVPAGTFENCLLIEQVTTEGDRPGDAADANRQSDMESLCGSRAAWYAPGVGLVQFRLRNTDGAEAYAHLIDYSLQAPGPSPLPLAIGNRWTYTWPDLPDRRAGRELYEITDRNGSDWYLESYGHLARRD
jgi:hypothetical protein